MEKNQSEVGFEEKRLNETIVIAEEQLKNLLKIVEEKHHEIIESKKEVWENATHSISNLWNPDGFESLVELSQCINPVTEKIIDYEEKERMIVRLKNLIKSPYFARIDFQFEDEDVPEKVYIGRSSLTGENAWEIYIYDWRSPIGSVFYRFMTGKAFYDAPCGRIKGIVTLKRQYEIENGVLKYFFDANIPIYDKFLRQMLSENTSAKMKAIVETIQQEQDIVIRDIENDLLMVQGVAGSGKTSIALHRVAYLMYWGLQEKLSANNIIIISPNSVFKQYISNVLPELGEENVIFTVFEDILRLVLKSSDFQPRNEFLEKSLSNAPHKAVMKNSMRFKMSVEFLNILNQFIDDIPRRWILFEDVYDEGICVVDKQILKNRILDRLEIPLGMNLGHLEDYILDLVAGVGHKRKSKIEVEMVKSKIEKFTKLDVVGLYRKLFSDEAYFGELMKESCSVERIKEIWNFTRENLESDRLYYDDAIAIAYLYLKIYGTNEYREIRQVVIDEAQDYDPLQYEIFRFLFPNAKFTILGDINQTIAKQEDLTLYEQIQKILKKRTSSLITLDKSFRCTNEILNYSLNFIEHSSKIVSYNRKGDNISVVSVDRYEVLVDEIIGELEICREKGFKTIGLICKTQKNCVRLFQFLKDEINVQLINNESAVELQGIFILPVYMSKGLEFDAVLLCDANLQNYSDEEDKNILYVACTRALHRLSLFSEGPISLWLTEI